MTEDGEAEGRPVQQRVPVEGAVSRRPTVRRREAMAKAKRELWKALPEIMLALIDGAKKGKVTHLKMLVELGGLTPGELRMTPKRTARPKSLVEVLMEQWEKEKAAVTAEAEAKVAGAGQRQDGGGSDGQ